MKSYLLLIATLVVTLDFTACGNQDDDQKPVEPEKAHIGFWQFQSITALQMGGGVATSTEKCIPYTITWCNEYDVFSDGTFDSYLNGNNDSEPYRQIYTVEYIDDQLSNINFILKESGGVTNTIVFDILEFDKTNKVAKVKPSLLQNGFLNPHTYQEIENIVFKIK